MKRYAFAGIVVGGVFGMVCVVHGCTLNPWAGISYEEAGGILGVPKGSSTGSGAGGAAGQGGSAGAGGAPCVCADDGNECTDDVIGECPGLDKAACHPVRFAQPCTAGTDYLCNINGVCQDCLACTDEEGCKARCNGIACSDPMMCKTNTCAQAVCCDQACQGPCKSCNREGQEGTCTRMPKGLQVEGCNQTKSCNGMGQCAMQTSRALGAACDASTDCTSGVCRAQYCRSDVNEPCIDDVECGTNLCDVETKTCKSCILAGGKCPGDAACDMSTGRCKALLGQPATLLDQNDKTKTDCAAGIFSGLLCALPKTSACTEHAECESRNCGSNVCADYCTDSAQCLAGTNCMNGSCKLLPGNYCFENWLCQSGKCTGFPRRCE